MAHVLLLVLNDENVKCGLFLCGLREIYKVYYGEKNVKPMTN